MKKTGSKRKKLVKSSKTSAIRDKNRDISAVITETSTIFSDLNPSDSHELKYLEPDEYGNYEIDIIRPIRVMPPLFQIASFSPVYTEISFFYTQEEFESIDIEDDCVLYSEHCMKAWNKKGEKHEQKA